MCRLREDTKQRKVTLFLHFSDTDNDRWEDLKSYTGCPWTSLTILSSSAGKPGIFPHSAFFIIAHVLVPKSSRIYLPSHPDCPRSGPPWLSPSLHPKTLVDTAASGASKGEIWAGPSILKNPSLPPYASTKSLPWLLRPSITLSFSLSSGCGRLEADPKPEPDKLIFHLEFLSQKPFLASSFS